MNSSLVARLEKALVVILALSFALPLVLQGVLFIGWKNTTATDWLRNATLAGMQIKPEKVSFSRSTLFSAKYQQSLAANYDFNFTGRELITRLIDEVYLRLFQQNPAGYVVGRAGSLFDPSYTEEYCLRRGHSSEFDALIGHLKRMQEICDERKIAFALVITPSKASVYPEDLPASWRRRYKPAPRYIDLLRPLLQANGIRYVDGYRVIADLKPTTRVRLFPLGGIHWGDPAALATTNAVLELLAAQGLNVRPIRDYKTFFSENPNPLDADLANTLNRLVPPHYPVADITVRPMPAQSGYRPNLVCVGGSFAGTMLRLLAESDQFSEMDDYFYYIRGHKLYRGDEEYVVANPTPPLNFDTDVFAADALLLELNEEMAAKIAAHLDLFLHDALLAAPAAHQPKAPFHYASPVDYRWGDTLSFVAGEKSIDPAALSGFTAPLSFGVFTLGSDAAIRLHVQPAKQDMVLEMEGGAFLVDTRLPEQRVQLAVNGRTVADWTWRADSPPHREVTIPRDLLTGEELRLNFHVARPVSPAEFGLSADENKYGLLLRSLRVRAEPQIEYHWGDTLSFVAGAGSIDPAALSGFTAPLSVGAFTVGSDAVVRLDVPPATQDMVLEVEAGAFLVDTRLPEQRVQVLADGHPVGEWVWHADSPLYHELTIPRALLTGGPLRLDFHVARPGSPAEFGLSVDTNKYGLLVRSLRLRARASPAE